MAETLGASYSPKSRRPAHTDDQHGGAYVMPTVNSRRPPDSQGGEGNKVLWPTEHAVKQPKFLGEGS